VILEAPEVTGSVLGVGVDLVHVPSFADQLALPGSHFTDMFTPGERAYIRGRGGEAEHWAARWAAKEAVVKAWSAWQHGLPPVMGEHALAQIETLADAWGRPRIVLHAEVARWLADCTVHLSMSHDGDHAIAYVVLSA
jgi:holo-[acyl-carrier protein] synthase